MSTRVNKRGTIVVHIAFQSRTVYLMSECISYRDVAPKVTEKCVTVSSRYSGDSRNFNRLELVPAIERRSETCRTFLISLFFHLLLLLFPLPRYYCLFTLSDVLLEFRLGVRLPKNRERERERERKETPRCKCLLYEIKEQPLNKFGRISLISVLLACLLAARPTTGCCGIIMFDRMFVCSNARADT